MKRLSAGLAALLVLCAILPAMAAPADEEIPAAELMWDENVDGTLTITRYTGTGTADILIPEQIEGRRVTRIGDGAFRGEQEEDSGSYERSDIKSVYIPDGIVAIGADAFEDCTALVEVRLPGTLRSIGQSAFSWCRSLAALDLPASLETIGSNAFYDCRSLAVISIPEGVRQVGISAFSGCVGAKSLSLPSSLASIESNAFYECTSLKDLVLPEGVESIGWLAFSGCSSLQTVWLPKSIRSIHGQAFVGDLQLKNVHYAGTEPELRATGIPEGVFHDARMHYESAPAPSATPTPTTMPSAEPSGTASTEPSQPPAPTQAAAMPEYLFSWTSAEDGSAVITHFDYSQAAQDGIATTHMRVPDEISGHKVTAIGESVFNASKMPASSSPTLSAYLPTGIASIGDDAFAGNAELSRLSLPSTLEEIGDGAFSGCRALLDMTLPASVRTIGSGAFADCASLAEITLPARLADIAPSLFEGCSALERLEIPQGAASIGAGALRGCSSLETLYIPASVRSIGAEALRGCSSLATIMYEGSATSFAAMEGVVDGVLPGVSPDTSIEFDSPGSSGEPTTTPEPTPAPVPSASGSPEATPTPSATEEPTESVGPSSSSTPTASPTPKPSPTPRPSSTAMLIPDGIQVVENSPLTFERVGEDVYAYGYEAKPAGQTLSAGTLKAQVWTSSSISCRILGPDGQEKADDAIVGTGDTIWCGRGTRAFLSATVVIQGDVLGSGTMSLRQLTTMSSAYLGTTTLEGAFLEAASFAHDGTVGLGDLVRESALYRQAMAPT